MGPKTQHYRSLRAQTLHYFARSHREIRRTPINNGAAWLGADMLKQSDWRVTLSPDEVAELDEAIEFAKATTKPLASLGQADFPLPTLSGQIEQWRASVQSGRGFQVVSGLPVDRWTQQEAELFFWCFGLHFGTPGAQNPQGDLLGHVKDTGANPAHERHYKTSSNINFHCDAADVVGLLCLQSAKVGGLSRLVSSVSIYNEFLRRRPDLVDRLYQPFQLDTHGEGGVHFLRVPPVRYTSGSLRTFYHTDYFRSAPARPGAAPLSDVDSEVLDLYDDIAASPKMQLQMEFAPGDIQLVNNHTLLHARTGYQDDPSRPRHLLRLWLSLPTHRRLSSRWRAQREKVRLALSVASLKLGRGRNAGPRAG